uniref:RNA recognition motif. (A.k.a. RRM, RBD, or RNP domain) n=1 Tax=Candidatus Kentrum sp. SD TaxID=2126332 RepID=A0A450Y6M1_9GAMM|nr:MAG: RNA recognition motif. (a.k.a. RRM, RBD, or RNP domain) [Candidatus Kentron sp. SD]VFK39724.1 MAG: RNA recognition motif. (a.k.a. RRM, RBD, or RNP domain) [Candidatus Kentron sp. SD]VFK79244.1 MAG: RNA recognition motif. (a.k.a. RRM, RBD, or RNP domain) [Candidatus Kentron sp. SD]
MGSRDPLRRRKAVLFFALTEDIRLKRMFVGNLPVNATEASVSDLFSKFGTVRSIRLVTDVFTGQCRGFGFVEMEGHEARAAIAGLDGMNMQGEKPLRVRFEDPKSIRGRRRR